MPKDPENYQHCSEPHIDLEAANEAITKFYEAVAAARKEFRMESVVVIVRVNIGDGSSITHGKYGEIGSAIDLLAYTYGYEMNARRAHTRQMETEGQRAFELEERKG